MRPSEDADHLAFTLQHAMHFVVVVLLGAAVLRAAAVGGGLVHGLGRTTAATLVAIVFFGVYLAGLRFLHSDTDLVGGVGSGWSTATRASSGVWVWLSALSLIWGAGVMVSDGFVWVALPLYLLVLGLLPDRAGAVAAFVLMVMSVGLGLLHGRVAGVATSSEVWLGMLVPACVALVGRVVFVQLRLDARRHRELAARLAAAHDSLAATERTQGVLAERERLAREIHDTIGQGLASIVVLARTADSGSTNTSDGTDADGADGADGAADAADGQVADTRDRSRAETLALIESTARDNLAEARRFIRDLGHPGEASLEESLRLLAQDAQRRTAAAGEPLDVEFAVEGSAPSDMDDRLTAALHRGVQASVANVIQHAHATRCRIGLAWFADHVVVDVVDDGVGFDPRSIDDREHFGLTALHSRAAEAGIDVTLDSAPGEGTTVALSAPLAAPALPPNDSAAEAIS